MYDLTVDDAHTFAVGAGWVVHNDCDLSGAQSSLTRIFRQYPSSSGQCETCAIQAATAIQVAYPDYTVEIIRLQNELAPGGHRGASIVARDANGQMFTIATDGKDLQPYHEVVRIQIENEYYIIDALVSEHQGINAMPIDEYFELFQYPDGIEITGVR